MIKIAAYLLVGIGIGVGFAYWQGAGGTGDDLASGLAPDDRAPIEQRLSQLETSLALERFEREQLAAELAALKDSYAAASSVDDNAGGEPRNPRERLAALANSDDENNPIAERIRQRFPDGIPQTAEEREQFLRQRQIDRLVEAGLTPERAQWILQREEALEMEVLKARYEATQNGAPAEEVGNLSASQMLRRELGDSDYEKYLQAQGRPTSVNVRDVLSNSPAQAAGLQPGDEIVAYNGERVFDINELNDLTYQAKPGGTVALDVIRDGQQMQVYVESGPIGISGGGRPSRRDFAGAGGFGGRGGASRGP
jgi:hypothetical protein